MVPPTKFPTANLRSYDVTDNAIRMLKTWKGSRNFLYIHYWDTHTPYAQPEKFIREFQNALGLRNPAYPSPRKILSSFKRPLLKPIDVACIRKLPSIEYALTAHDVATAHLDEQIGRLLHVLDTSDLMEQTVVIITADHGESLLEHGIFFDHQSLY